MLSPWSSERAHSRQKPLPGYEKPRPFARKSPVAPCAAVPTSDERQQAAIDALLAKCDILWAQLDALYHGYVAPGHIPPGAFQPAGQD